MVTGSAELNEIEFLELGPFPKVWGVKKNGAKIRLNMRLYFVIFGGLRYFMATYSNSQPAGNRNLCGSRDQAELRQEKNRKCLTGFGVGGFKFIVFLPCPIKVWMLFDKSL